MICVHSRWEVRGSNLNSRIRRTPAAADGWLVRRAERGPVISDCHSPDHSSGRGGTRYSVADVEASRARGSRLSARRPGILIGAEVE